MQEKTFALVRRNFCIALFVALSVLVACNPDQRQTEKQATANAEMRLEKFALERGIKPETFRRTRVRFDRDVGVWQVDFDQDASNGLLVTILVGGNGFAELTYTTKKSSL